MEDVLLSYPQEEDSLFSEIASKGHNISLDPYVFLGPLGDNWDQYISGYKDAADILVDKNIDNRSVRDFIAFPTIFLYRHCIELSLKSIIKYGNQLYNIQSDYERIHSIENLWRACREIIERGWPKELYKTLDATENIIKEFSKIDPTSSGTRYPEKKDGSFTMDDIPNINLKNMKGLMEKIYKFLGDMDDAISIQLSEKQNI